jgi:hypothetical protein
VTSPSSHNTRLPLGSPVSDASETLSPLSVSSQTSSETKSPVADNSPSSTLDTPTSNNSSTTAATISSSSTNSGSSSSSSSSSNGISTISATAAVTASASAADVQSLLSLPHMRELLADNFDPSHSAFGSGGCGSRTPEQVEEAVEYLERIAAQLQALQASLVKDIQVHPFG